MPARPYRGLSPILPLALLLGSLTAVVDLRAQPVPIGPEMGLSPADGIYRESPRAVVDSRGRLVVIWREWESDAAGNRPVRLAGRRFDPEGRPLGEVFQVSSLPFTHVEPAALAAGPDGRFAVAWMGYLDSFRVFFRLFDASGGATGVERSVHEPGPRLQVAPTVAMGTDGGLLVTWLVQDPEGAFSRLFVRSFDAGGRPREPAFAVYPVPRRVYVASALAALPGGRFAIAWRAESDDGKKSLLARILDARGLPEGRVVTVRPPEPYPYLGAPSLSADAQGRFVVVWHDFDGHGNGIFARRFDPDARPLGEVTRLNETLFGDQEYPHVASTADGSFLAAWKSEGQGGHLFGRYVDAAGGASSEIPLDPPDRTGSYVHLPRLACDPRGNFVAVWGALVGEPPVEGGAILGRRFSASCRFGSEPLALHDGRFEVEACWHGFEGFRAPAQGSPVSDHAGVLRFFPGDEPEMVVKIEEGPKTDSGMAGPFRVFLGGLTHLEVLLRITDTVTGASKGYLNPLGTLTSRLDPSAFTDSGAGEAPVKSGTAKVGTLPAPPCRCDPRLRLDLLDGRIRVEALWTDPEGGIGGFGQGVPLSRESGTLWFSHPDDPDLAVKVLDGREINGRWWVFLAALTEREAVITVSDTDTGRQRVYTKASDSLRSWVDLSTFED